MSPYWQFFLAIESDLAATSRYVEVTPDNYATFSIEYTRIILSACSEIDVVAKVLCQKVAPGRASANMNNYRCALTEKYPQFHTVRILVPRWGLALNPWEKWRSNNENPPWWTSYNKVKHERNKSFQEANLENALNSVAGLFALVLYLFQPELYDGKLKPWAGFFALEHEPGAIMLEADYELPDFPHAKRRTPNAP